MSNFINQRWSLWLHHLPKLRGQLQKTLKSIERFGVIAVGDTGSWEFTTGYETSPDHLSKASARLACAR